MATNTALPLPILADGTIEQLGAGVTLEWTYQQRIAIISAPRATREAVDAWMDAIHRTVALWADWPPPTGIIYDLTSPTIGPTPYLRDKVNQILAEARTDVPGYIGVVPSNTLFGQFFRGLINVLPTRRGFTIRAFSSRSAAVRWLSAIIDAGLSASNNPHPPAPPQP